MWCAVELPDIHDVAFVFQHCRFVIIYIEVIWGGENGHHGWKTCRLGFAVHAVSSILGLVCPDDGEEVISFQELAGRLIAVKVIYPSGWVGGAGGVTHVKK